MKIFVALASLATVLLCPAMTYAADECSAVIHQLPSASSYELDGCVCDASPKNLRKDNISPFRIVAACNLRWELGKPINPAKQQFPPEEKNHQYAYGAVFMLGDALLEGRLQSNEMGQVILYLDKPFMLGGVVYKVSDLEVGIPPKNILVIPEHLRHLSCLDGRAKVKVNDLFIMFNDITSVEVSTRAPIFLSASLDKPCSD